MPISTKVGVEKLAFPPTSYFPAYADLTLTLRVHRYNNDTNHSGCAQPCRPINLVQHDIRLSRISATTLH